MREQDSNKIKQEQEQEVIGKHDTFVFLDWVLNSKSSIPLRFFKLPKIFELRFVTDMNGLKIPTASEVISHNNNS